MQGIGEEVGTAVQWCEEVDELCASSAGHLFYGLLHLCVPVACASLVTGMAVEDGCHPAYEDASLGVHREEGIYQRAVVGNELLLPVRPVARVGVIETEVDDDPVGLEVEGLMELRQVDVGAVAFVEEGGSRVSEIGDFESAGTIGAVEHLLQTNGICIALAVSEAVAIGDAVAHTGDSQRWNRRTNRRKQGHARR